MLFFFIVLSVGCPHRLYSEKGLSLLSLCLDSSCLGYHHFIDITHPILDHLLAGNMFQFPIIDVSGNEFIQFRILALASRENEAIQPRDIYMIPSISHFCMSGFIFAVSVCIYSMYLLVG